MKFRVESLEKRFPGFFCSLSFEAELGSFITLLGPSGSGKSTSLQLISGLIRPDSGSMYLGDDLLSDLEPWERGIGFVFQDYALFPHMKVFDNVAYGLRIPGRGRTMGEKEIARRVRDLLSMTGLEAYEERMPATLSGGEQQRVALARALAPNPRLLLLDEPLSALDAPLRIRLRREIRDLQQKLQLTTLYVTHDRDEALSMSDQIVVMREGYTLEQGTPQELYRSPKHLFTASFLGECSPCPAGKAFFRPEDGDLHLQPRPDSIRVRISSLSYFGHLVKAEVEPVEEENREGSAAPGVRSPIHVSLPGNRYEELLQLKERPLYLTIQREGRFYPDKEISI